MSVTLLHNATAITMYISKASLLLVPKQAALPLHDAEGTTWHLKLKACVCSSSYDVSAFGRERFAVHAGMLPGGHASGGQA